MKIACIYSSSSVNRVVYHPSECQVVTVGAGGTVNYWETYDGSAVRELTSSHAAPVNALDIASDGTKILTGGKDKILKVM